MAGETLNSNQKALIMFAQDHEKNNLRYWAISMTRTHADRKFFTTQFSDFQEHRYWIEIGIKTAVTVTLGIGLFMAAPASLLFGAALTLSLSSLIYANINLPDHKIELPAKEEELANFNEAKWAAYRTTWLSEARRHGSSEDQKALYVNMQRLGLVLVCGFAVFTAISSGVGVAIAIATVLYAGSLFNRAIDESAPYIEVESALPPLTM